jgi:hypothetical protein
VSSYIGLGIVRCSLQTDTPCQLGVNPDAQQSQEFSAFHVVLGQFRRVENFESPEHSTAARLSLTRVQLLQRALQLFKLLPSLAELAFRRQALVVGKVFGGFRDQRVEVRCGLG